MEKLFILIFLFLGLNELQAQQELSILSWNVENLFYPTRDSAIRDEEFTPEGIRHWTFSRYQKKCNYLWKTIFLATENGPPDIVALCEIENIKVLKEIFCYSPLNNYSYSFVHRDSPDPRGIDVAVAYRSDKLKLIKPEFLCLDFPELNNRMTREIIHAEFLWGKDSLHVFVNHWPSKYGGAGYTDILRIRSAEFLMESIDSVYSHKPEARIICCGDFNDSPDSRSVGLLIKAGPDKSRGRLNLVPAESEIAEGSLKYQGNWEDIDNFFTGGISLNACSQRSLRVFRAQILEPAYLFVKDEKYGGLKPWRTYTGYKYTGGISDHLPLILFLRKD